MITFKKNWLYRYNEWCDGNLYTFDKVNDSRSICTYFWKSLWNLLGVNLIYVIIAHTPSLCGVWVTEFNVLEGLGGFSLFYIALLVGYVSLLAFILAATGIVLGCKYITSLFKSGKEGKSSVVIEYVKAKKAKICPMIEWED